MKLIQKTLNFLEENKKKRDYHKKEKLLKYLFELKELEAKLWGVYINHLKNGEEEILEDTNHLIHLISRKKEDDLKQILELKQVNDFIKDLKNLKNDFLYFKKKIHYRNELKNAISNFTIKLVEPNNFGTLENIFLLEKKLYDLLDEQEEAINEILKDVSKLRIETEEQKINLFLISLKKIRDILAGHKDLDYLFEKERLGFSTTSNIINSLIKMVKSNLN